MVERELEPLDERVTELLDQHSTGLLVGDDHSTEFLGEHSEDFPALAGLIQVAQRLRDTLVPVHPDEDFVSDLRTRLVSVNEKESRAATAWTQLRARLTRHSTALGAAISILAVLAMAIRVVGSLLMVVVLLSGNRRRRTAAA